MVRIPPPPPGTKAWEAYVRHEAERQAIKEARWQAMIDASPFTQALLNEAKAYHEAHGEWPKVMRRTKKVSKENEAMTKLKKARKKVQELASIVRDQAFDDWLERWTVKAERPDEWTQARVLYENYLKRAKEFGNNQSEKRLSKEELATETRWGRMMGAVYEKHRRPRAYYYPVRLKGDA